jgi:hypothetical protein
MRYTLVEQVINFKLTEGIALEDQLISSFLFILVGKLKEKEKDNKRMEKRKINPKRGKGVLFSQFKIKTCVAIFLLKKLSRLYDCILLPKDLSNHFFPVAKWKLCQKTNLVNQEFFLTILVVPPRIITAQMIQHIDML